MKNKLKVMFIILLILGISGCSNKEKVEGSKKVNTEKIVQEKKENDLTESDIDKSAEQEQEPEQEKIYYIEPETGEMVYEEVPVRKNDGIEVWSALQDIGVVPAESRILSIEQNGDLLVLNVDSVFGDYFRKQGTTGENEILKCIINTFLDAFNGKQIKITEEGYDLASSHRIYEEYMTKIQ